MAADTHNPEIDTKRADKAPPPMHDFFSRNQPAIAEICGRLDVFDSTTTGIDFDPERSDADCSSSSKKITASTTTSD